jgi:hypothetical protein
MFRPIRPLFPIALVVLLALALHGCVAKGVEDPMAIGVDASTDAVTETAPPEDSEPPDASVEADQFVPFDAFSEAGPWDPDSACATTVAEAPTFQLPVDIIWIVDNSASMKPAIDQLTLGLNDFAELIGTSAIDYRVIMLSLRSKTNPVSIGGGTRYAVCIPPPLAGDDECGNGSRFLQSSVDIRSTQPLEQFLGTLDQTEGYQEGQERGGEPWSHFLRPEATKSIVVVTDDNARLNPVDFEYFGGGKNPFNSLTLPPGILDPSRGGSFEGYLFHGLYGWGEDLHPASEPKCTYPNQSQPPSEGRNYTILVKKTGGVRAQICAGASAWQPFFDGVAQAVIATSKIECVFDIPPPEDGPINPGAVNVRIVGDEGETRVFKVPGAADCDEDGGWYYDDEDSPTQVILCSASCALAQEQVGVGKDGRIEVAYGCPTEVK